MIKPKIQVFTEHFTKIKTNNKERKEKRKLSHTTIYQLQQLKLRVCKSYKCKEIDLTEHTKLELF